MSELQQDNLLDVLARISQAAAENALQLPHEKTQLGDWRGIGFRLGEQIFVASMSEVDEVLTLPSYTRVPGVKNWLNGVANIRGRLLAVIDLGLMLGRAPCSRSAKSRLLAIRKDDLYSGIIVDEVLGLQTFTQQEQREGNSAEQDVSAYLTGGFEKNGRYWPVFSLHQLVQTPEFMGVTA